MPAYQVYNMQVFAFKVVRDDACHPIAEHVNKRTQMQESRSWSAYTMASRTKAEECLKHNKINCNICMCMVYRTSVHSIFIGLHYMIYCECNTNIVIARQAVSTDLMNNQKTIYKFIYKVKYYGSYT